MTISPASDSERSSTGFARLSEPVRRWIWRKGWTELRDIQERAIAALLDGEADIIIAASTAGGKTEAAFLPLISRVIENSAHSGFDLVYVGPFKALINDQFSRLTELCDLAELPVYPWHGNIAAGVKARARNNPRGVLLITPESLEALFVLRGLEVPKLFARTQAVVIDELHALLDNPRGVHLRSLLTRLEIAVGHPIRRVGLSATLGDMSLTRAYLRPEAPEAVDLLESSNDGQEIRVQIRGYVVRGAYASSVDDSEEDGTPDYSTTRAIGEHLFSRLRGSRNLVFTGSRQKVEEYSDLLRMLCEGNSLPNEFFPHHASLSQTHRGFVEQRLKDDRLPLTAICTSTLELGIDIGDITCVGQIGAPWSVASLRQRLGRSGRRANQPAVLRMYVSEPQLSSRSHPVDRLRLGLVRGIAMIELLKEGWCEPPRPEAPHLSTLTHQILSVIAERGGASARRLFTTLCNRGPFRQVDQTLFACLLRRLGEPEVALIEQSPDGTLLLGQEGERLVEHYSFYAVFQTPEEYRILAGGKSLGALPVGSVLVRGMAIIFSGRRWRIENVHDRDKVIEVTPDSRGRPPAFGGEGGIVHDAVVERMRAVLRGSESPRYLDAQATELLSEARGEFVRLGLDRQRLIEFDDGRFLAATWAGTIGTSTLALILRGRGHFVSTYDGFIDISPSTEHGRPVPDTLVALSSGELSPQSLLPKERATLASEKFHTHLDDELLLVDALGSRLDIEAVPKLAKALLE